MKRGLGKFGQILAPARSFVGLALQPSPLSCFSETFSGIISRHKLSDVVRQLMPGREEKEEEGEEGALWI